MNRESQIAIESHAPLFAEARGDIQVSFEFFPPKTDAMAETLWRSIETLAPLKPRFVSVTYGAGGSTRERTHATVERIAKETELTPAAHLTCVGATREEIDAIARRAVELMSDKVIREIAWEVVPDLAELLIKRQLEENQAK